MQLWGYCQCSVWSYSCSKASFFCRSLCIVERQNRWPLGREKSPIDFFFLRPSRWIIIPSTSDPTIQSSNTAALTTPSSLSTVHGSYSIARYLSTFQRGSILEEYLTSSHDTHSWHIIVSCASHILPLNVQSTHLRPNDHGHFQHGSECEEYPVIMMMESSKVVAISLGKHSW